MEKFNITSLPFLPDTVAEGKFYGFDVCVGNYFLQFKRSHLYQANHSPSWLSNRINEDHFRLYIKANKSQYRFLKRMSGYNSRFNKVLYVSPEFHTRTELRTYYQAKTIIDNSAHFSLNDFPGDLKGNHYLTYTSNEPQGILHSEPFNIRKTYIELDIGNNLSISLRLFDMARKIYDTLDPLVAETVSYNQDQESFIRQVQHTLLMEYQIIWLPVLLSGN